MWQSHLILVHGYRSGAEQYPYIVTIFAVCLCVCVCMCCVCSVSCVLVYMFVCVCVRVCTSEESTYIATRVVLVTSGGVGL